MKHILLLLFIALVCPAVTDAQYCMLPGRTSYSNDQPGITNFKLGTIDRTSVGVENTLSQPPVVVTGDSTTLQRGETYTVSITHSKDAAFFPTARNNIRVWIDYNGNEDFTDANETVVSKDLEPNASTTTATFTVPMDAPLGVTRLRATAKMSADAGHSLPTPCDEPKDPIDYHGEMEDYFVTITPATGINGINNNLSQVSVYPNPVSDKLNVSFKDISNEPLQIDLMDVTGKHIANLLTDAHQSSLSYSFSLSNHTLLQGVYFVKVSSAGALSFRKIVKVD